MTGAVSIRIYEKNNQRLSLSVIFLRLKFPPDRGIYENYIALGVNIQKNARFSLAFLVSVILRYEESNISLLPGNMDPSFVRMTGTKIL